MHYISLVQVQYSFRNVSLFRELSGQYLFDIAHFSILLFLYFLYFLSQYLLYFNSFYKNDQQSIWNCYELGNSHQCNLWKSDTSRKLYCIFIGGINLEFRFVQLDSTITKLHTTWNCDIDINFHSKIFNIQIEWYSQTFL